MPVIGNTKNVSKAFRRESFSSDRGLARRPEPMHLGESSTVNSPGGRCKEIVMDDKNDNERKGKSDYHSNDSC